METILLKAQKIIMIRDRMGVEAYYQQQA